jgi:signal transduction histidine kinase
MKKEIMERNQPGKILQDFKALLEIHMGLSTMKERVELSGGSFSIESIKGRRTAVKARWKIDEH